MRRISLVVAGCLVTAATAPIAHAQSDGTRRWTFGSSLGVDPFKLDLRTRDPGVDARGFVTLFAEHRVGASRWVLRPELLYGHQFDRGTNFSECAGCSFHSSQDVGGASLSARYELWRGSIVQPYAIGGLGWFGVRTSLTSTMRCEAPIPAPTFCTPVAQPRSHVAPFDGTLAGNFGLGTTIAIGSARLFIEQRYFHVRTPWMRDGLRPLNLGVRF